MWLLSPRTAADLGGSGRPRLGSVVQGLVPSSLPGEGQGVLQGCQAGPGGSLVPSSLPEEGLGVLQGCRAGPGGSLVTGGGWEPLLCRGCSCSFLSGSRGSSLCKEGKLRSLSLFPPSGGCRDCLAEGASDVGCRMLLPLLGSRSQGVPVPTGGRKGSLARGLTSSRPSWWPGFPQGPRAFSVARACVWMSERAPPTDDRFLWSLVLAACGGLGSGAGSLRTAALAACSSVLAVEGPLSDGSLPPGFSREGTPSGRGGPGALDGWAPLRACPGEGRPLVLELEPGSWRALGPPSLHWGSFSASVAGLLVAWEMSLPGFSAGSGGEADGELWRPRLGGRNRGSSR